MSHKYLHRLVSLIFNTRRLMQENTRCQHQIDVNSYLQLETLQFISDKCSPTMHQLADFLHITPPSATSLVSVLVKNKQVNRLPDKKDRRIIRLTLTNLGGKELKEGMSRMASRMESIFVKLSERERRHLIKILEQLSLSFNKHRTRQTRKS